MHYIGIFSGIFWTEFFIKAIVEKTRKTGITKKLFGGKILLKKVHNKGFAMNVMDKKQKFVAMASLVLTGMLSVAAIVFGSKRNGLIKAGLAFVLGGAFSNTYDRLHRKYVVDYISLGVKNKHLQKIVFNLADLCILAGAVLIAMGGMIHENIGKRKICSKSDGGLGSAQ